MAGSLTRVPPARLVPTTALRSADPRPGAGDTRVAPYIWRTGLDILQHHRLGASTRSLVQAMVGGLFGHREGPWTPLVPRMSFRHNYQDVPAEYFLPLLAPTHGRGRPIDVAVLVHGLLIDEQNWSLAGDSVAGALHRRLGWASLEVRYNSGLHVSHNGSALADLLQDLHRQWGPRLGRVRLIGHSMGGLVCRSALEMLRRANAEVLNHIDQLYLLATPNQGADLERLGHAVEYVLETASEAPRSMAHWATRLWRPRERQGLDIEAIHAAAELVSVVTGTPFRSLLSIIAARSDGMRDVRFGYMVPEEWQSAEHDADRFMINHSRPLPPPPGVRTFAIAGSLWPDSTGEPSRLRTDGLVSVASAAGIGVDYDDLGVVANGRFAEMPLLVHQLVACSPRVIDRIRGWARE